MANLTCPDCGAHLPPAPTPEHAAALLTIHRPVCPRTTSTPQRGDSQ